MYFDYLKESQDIDNLQNEFGFVSYRIKGHECWIKDWYVKPEHRGKTAAMRLIKDLEIIARSECCDCITSNVDIGTERAEKNTLILLRYGCKIVGATNYSIFFKKEV